MARDLGSVVIQQMDCTSKLIVRVQSSLEQYVELCVLLFSSNLAFRELSNLLEDKYLEDRAQRRIPSSRDAEPQ
jgi:hypothetical protein